MKYFLIPICTYIFYMLYFFRLIWNFSNITIITVPTNFRNVLYNTQHVHKNQVKLLLYGPSYKNAYILLFRLII